MAAICPDFKWLGFCISDPFRNLDYLQPILFSSIQSQTSPDFISHCTSKFHTYPIQSFPDQLACSGCLSTPAWIRGTGGRQSEGRWGKKNIHYKKVNFTQNVNSLNFLVDRDQPHRSRARRRILRAQDKRLESERISRRRWRWRQWRHRYQSTRQRQTTEEEKEEEKEPARRVGPTSCRRGREKKERYWDGR